MVKTKLATVWCDGCAGCHMSLLDLDEALIDLLCRIELTVTPLTDIKGFAFPEVDLGIIEGAIGNTEQLEIVQRLRRQARWILALGDCAVFGGINTLRNPIPVDALLDCSYIHTPGTVDGLLPLHRELPVLLERVLPVNGVIPVDLYVPGCPPSPEAIAYALNRVLEGEPPALPSGLIHFD